MVWLLWHDELLSPSQAVHQERRKVKWNVILVWYGENRMEISKWPYDQLPILTAVLFCFPPTEASKFVMSYVAAVCGKGAEVNQVKEQLLQSNPVLEGMFLTSMYYLCISASLMSWLWKRYPLLFCTYSVSKTVGGAFCENSQTKLFSYREVFLKMEFFPQEVRA